MNLFSREQYILVTGASSGIGRACAMLCNARGASVIACGRNEARLREAQAKCASPAHWHNETKDLLAELESLPQWVAALRQKYGRLWGLIHAAGEGRLDSIACFELAEAKRHHDLNFFAPMQLARGFADRRNFLKGGAMLFLSSASAVYPEKGHCVYGAAKAALATAMKSVSQEMAAKGLRVHCLAPGWIRTPMLDAATKSMGESYAAREEGRYPLGFGEPEDVAEMAVFLLSEKARWITGQNFVLGGGCY
ncbi:SDR family oxidoreductase [Desulfovibrio sp. ZJ200]|uniref:SDR family NAD(P)-dependent oxidoreductase n=1 Tax=Desulfovibrio sp. ZJ200 TaxID=2709792 RepID=UPI001F14DA24|nr:SDR family oxidoreductase [Desulfovibrio sp. ZJ200]